MTQTESPTVSPLPISCLLSRLHVADYCLFPAEDSGNSSEDSESEEPSNKKQSPWQGRSEVPPLQEEVVAKEEEASEVTIVANNTTDTLMVGQLTTATQSRDVPQEIPDKFLSQSEEEEEEEPGEEPAGEAAVSLVHQDEEKTLPSGQEMFLMCPPVGSSPAPAEENDRSTPLSSSRDKAHRIRESPPGIPFCTPTSVSTTHMVSPHGVLKRQDEPMVVLHCLPTQHLHPDVAAADSDTDSATEDEEAPEEAGSEERTSAFPHMAADNLQSAEKRLCPDRMQGEATPPTISPASPQDLPTMLLKLESERSEEVMKADEQLQPPEEPQSEEHPTAAAMKEPQVHDGTPPPAAEAPGPAPAEELEPQIGPEALVCYEVDLDDPEDKEKPTSAPEHLLLMMREQQAPPPLATLLPQHQVLPTAAPSHTSCPEELHQPQNVAEERGAARGEKEEDSGTASAALLQESRGKTAGCLFSKSVHNQR